jgi:hypothetical protein
MGLIVVRLFFVGGRFENLAQNLLEHPRDARAVQPRK